MKKDGRPRQQQIAAEIRAAIVAGDLPAGTQLPKTHELAERYNVSAPTIQQALALLKEEGFIVGKRGTGVYVRDRQPFVVDIKHYFVPTPGGYSYDILEVAEVEPPPDIAKGLKLAEGETAILRRRLTRFNGEPVDLSSAYYPTAIARGTKLETAPKIKGGAPKVLAELGYPERWFVDEVSVRPPTTDEVQLLELPDGVPVMRQARILYSDNEKPVEASVLVKGGHLFVLRYHQPIN